MSVSAFLNWCLRIRKTGKVPVNHENNIKGRLLISFLQKRQASVFWNFFDSSVSARIGFNLRFVKMLQAPQLLTTRHGMTIGLASTGSALAVLVSLTVAGVLFRDINSLYSEIMQEMGEFKVGFSCLNSHCPSRPSLTMLGMEWFWCKDNNQVASVRTLVWNLFPRWPVRRALGDTVNYVVTGSKRGGYSSGNYAKPQCSECFSVLSNRINLPI